MDKKSMLMQLIQQYENGSKARFAKRLGLTPQGVSTWLSRGTIDYELIYAKCEYVSADWLLSGEGSMLRTDDALQSTEAKSVPASSDAVVLRLMDKLDNKDAENKQLQSELRAMEKELTVLKSQKGLDAIPLAFTPGSSEAYSENYSRTKKDNASSGRSLGGKI